MAITAKQVFDISCSLMDEISETGNVVVENPASYKTKTCSILTMLQSELLPDSTTPLIITSIDDTLLLPDRDCILILPYGLAAHLLLKEDQNSASFFNSRYEELKEKRLIEATPITAIYTVGE